MRIEDAPISTPAASFRHLMQHWSEQPVPVAVVLNSLTTLALMT